MKTPEEIKKWLECCSLTDVAEIAKYAKRGIPYACVEDLIADALALIQQLEKELELERSVKKATLELMSSGDTIWKIERMPGWISVEDDKPKEYENVNVYVAGDDGCRYTSTGFYDGKHWRGYGNRFDVVTHWMPLPEPPEV